MAIPHDAIKGTLIERPATKLELFIEDKIIQNYYFQLVINLMTVYALFGDDVRLLFQTRVDSIDAWFLGLSLLAFILFHFELILQSFAVRGYFHWPRREGMSRWEQILACDIPTGSFYFWLDLIATYSLIFELTRIVEEWGKDDPLGSEPLELQLGLVDNFYESDAGGGQSSDSSENFEAGSAASSARAGRASRAGAKGGRIIRIVRMVRLVRIAKLAKTYETHSELHQSSRAEESGRRSSVRRTSNAKVTPDNSAGESLEELQPDSQIGKSMSELTQRRVIVGVLVILVVFPLLENQITDYSSLYSTRLAHSFLYKKNLCNSSLELIRSKGKVGCEYLLSGLNTSNQMVIANQRSNNELVTMTHEVSSPMGTWGTECNRESWLEGGTVPSTCMHNSTLTVVHSKLAGKSGIAFLGSTNNIRKSSREDIVIKSYNTAGAGMRFRTETQWDISNLKAEESAMNLLLTTFIILLLALGTMAFTSDTDRLVIKPIENMMKRVTEIGNDPLSTSSASKFDDDGMETTFLLQTIDKIGNLMRIGFGEAGAQIIASNLRDSSDSKLNIDSILSSGRGIVSIFGFCDIRNFTDTTECLQEEVMTFVNRIAHILHNVVKDCKGSANKNIGDAFLLTWKVPSEMCNERTGEVEQNAYTSDLFDNALYAFLKCTVLLRRHDDFVTSFSNESNRRLYQRMPNYRCAMGMGLHVGVAVEGAIGTHQKIDATYVSLQVNNAELLESSTKAYKVPLLMSHFFRDRLSPEAQSCCRQLDSIKITDDLHFDLWTYDIDYDADYSLKHDMTIHDQPSNGIEELEKESTKPLLNKRKITLVDPDKKARTLLGDPDGKEMSRVPVPPIDTFPRDASGKQGGYRPILWSTDPDLKLLRHKMAHDGFMKDWAICSKLYFDGRWTECMKYLEHFQETFRHDNGCRDGPADFLMAFILSHASASGEIIDDIGHNTLKRLPH